MIWFRGELESHVRFLVAIEQWNRLFDTTSDWLSRNVRPTILFNLEQESHVTMESISFLFDGERNFSSSFDDFYVILQNLGKANVVLKDCPSSSVKRDLDQSRSRSKISNHSARKYAIQKLLDNNVDPLHVAQLSGHKNVESLQNYHTASVSKQRNMSDSR